MSAFSRRVLVPLASTRLSRAALRLGRAAAMGLLGGFIGLAIGASIYQFGRAVGAAVDFPAPAPSGSDDPHTSARPDDTPASAPAPTLVPRTVSDDGLVAAMAATAEPTTRC